jgi:4'-phosphopantetheinyl transferase
MKYYFYKCSETDLKKQRALARCLFKYAIGNENAEFIKDERGKPYIPNSDLHMSISHCGAGVACIIADEPVGIDVEEISRFGRVKPKFARRICTESELELLESADISDRQELLCRFWVLKEAYSKLTGKGLSEKFNTIETIENKQLYAIKKGNVYIGIAATSLDCRPTGSYPSLL